MLSALRQFRGALFSCGPPRRVVRPVGALPQVCTSTPALRHHEGVPRELLDQALDVMFCLEFYAAAKRRLRRRCLRYSARRSDG